MQPLKCGQRVYIGKISQLGIKRSYICVWFYLYIGHHLCPDPTPIKIFDRRIGIHGNQIVKMEVGICRLFFGNAGHFYCDPIISNLNQLSQCRFIAKKSFGSFIRKNNFASSIKGGCCDRLLLVENQKMKKN